MYLFYFVIISSWTRAWPFIWTNLNPLYPRMPCAKFDCNWPSGLRRFLKFINVFSLFRSYLPLEKGVVLPLNKLVFPLPKNALCHDCLKWARWSLKRRFLKFFNFFSLFRNYFPWKKALPFIWTNLNLLRPRILCAKFGKNWPGGSWEEDFLILSMYFRYFVIISAWKRTWSSFVQTWIPSTYGCFVPSLIEIGPLVLEKKVKMWKVYNNHDNNKDEGKRTNFDQKS